MQRMEEPDLLDRMERQARVSAPSQVWVQLTENERAYVRRYWDRKRYADMKAQAASNRWEERSNWLKEYIAAQNENMMAVSGRAAYSEKAIRDKINDDWTLTDAFSEWSFWERESKRCLGVIQCELMARQLIGVLPL